MSFPPRYVINTRLLVMLLVISIVGVGRAQEAPAPVYGVHDIELGEGVDPAEFETYIVEKFVPAWKEPRNGMSMMVMKGDRGERKGKYQIVYVFDSVGTRDKFFPTETGDPSELFHETMEPVLEVMQGLSKFKIERTAFTDYAPVGAYMPPKAGTTPVIAVRNIELGDDVDVKKFEQFVKDKFAPIWKEPREGLQLAFTKGDRGERKGKFQFVWVFESIENRNKYFPQEGGGSTGKLDEVIESAGDVMQELQQFPLNSPTYTDYYPLNPGTGK